MKKPKNLYQKIEKEHVFVFLVLLTAVIFSFYFGSDEITARAIASDNCEAKGYACCSASDGAGLHYGAYDSSCLAGKGCYDSCSVSSEKNEGFFANVINWFKGLFGKKAVGIDVGTTCTKHDDCAGDQVCVSSQATGGISTGTRRTAMVVKDVITGNAIDVTNPSKIVFSGTAEEFRNRMNSLRYGFKGEHKCGTTFPTRLHKISMTAGQTITISVDFAACIEGSSKSAVASINFFDSFGNEIPHAKVYTTFQSGRYSSLSAQEDITYTAPVDGVVYIQIGGNVFTKRYTIKEIVINTPTPAAFSNTPENSPSNTALDTNYFFPVFDGPATCQPAGGERYMQQSFIGFPRSDVYLPDGSNRRLLSTIAVGINDADVKCEYGSGGNSLIETAKIIEGETRAICGMNVKNYDSDLTNAYAVLIVSDNGETFNCGGFGGSCDDVMTCAADKELVVDGTCAAGKICCKFSPYNCQRANGQTCDSGTRCGAGKEQAGASWTCAPNSVCCKPIEDTCTTTSGQTCETGTCVSINKDVGSGVCPIGNCCKLRQGCTSNAQCNTAPSICYNALGTCSSGICSYTPKQIGANCVINNIAGTCDANSVCQPTYTCTQTIGQTCDASIICGDGKIAGTGTCATGTTCCKSATVCDTSTLGNSCATGSRKGICALTGIMNSEMPTCLTAGTVAKYNSKYYDGCRGYVNAECDNSITDGTYTKVGQCLPNINDELVCTAGTYGKCTGTVIANSLLCDSDDLGIGTTDIAISLVSNISYCTANKKCEYYCKAGYIKSGNTNTCVKDDGDKTAAICNVYAGTKWVNEATIKCCGDDTNEYPKLVSGTTYKCCSNAGMYINANGQCSNDFASCPTTPANLVSAEADDNEVYIYGKTDIDCKVELTDATKKLADVKNCIGASVNGIECTDVTARESSGILQFSDCSVGTTPKTNADIKCYVKGGSTKAIATTINITDYQYCKLGPKGDSISNFDVDVEPDVDDWADDDSVDVTVTFENRADDEKDFDAIIKYVLIDFSDGAKKIIENETKVRAEYKEEVEETLSFDVPNSVYQEDKYALFVKVYKYNKESSQCVEQKSEVFDIDTENTREEECDRDSDCDEDNDEICYEGECMEEECTTETEDEDCSETEFCDGGICALIETEDTSCDGVVCDEGKECIQGFCAVVDVPDTGDCDPECESGQSCRNGKCVAASSGKIDSDADGLSDEFELEYGTDPQKADTDGDGILDGEERDQGTNPLVAERKVGLSGLTWLVITLVILIAAGAIGAWLYLRGKGGPSTGGSSNLKAYVKNSLAKGYSKEQVRHALESKGWSKSEIEDAFNK